METKRAKKTKKPLPEVLTLSEAARFLRLPQDKVRALAAGGDIPARMIVVCRIV